MLSLNTRKVLFSLIGITVVDIIVSAAMMLDILGSASMTVAATSPIWFVIISQIVGWYVKLSQIISYGFGIIIGLLWEKSTRAQYLAKIKSSSVPSSRAKRFYNIVLCVVVVWGVSFVLLNARVIYMLVAMHQHASLSSDDLANFYESFADNCILAIVFGWLYVEPKPKQPSPILDIKAGLLFVSVFSSVMAILDIIHILVLR